MMRRIAIALVILLFLECENRRAPSVRSRLVPSNPIATCGGSGTEKPVNMGCLSLRLSSIEAESSKDGVRFAGGFVIHNGCDAAVAFLSAPIDTRAPLVTAWEESIFGVYARFEVFEAAPHIEPFENRTIPSMCCQTLSSFGSC